MTPKTYDEILQQSIEEEWGYVPTRCPHCGNGAVSYFSKDYGLWDCSCENCGEEWWQLMDDDESDES